MVVGARQASGLHYLPLRNRRLLLDQGLPETE